jgi:hypothetical protein
MKNEKNNRDIITSSWIAFAPAWVPFPPTTKSMSILLAYKSYSYHYKREITIIH